MRTRERDAAFKDFYRVESPRLLRLATITGEADWNDFVRRAHWSLYARRATAALGAVALVVIAVFAAVTLRPAPDLDPAPLSPVDTPASPQPEATAASKQQVKVPMSESELWFVMDGRLSWGTTALGGRISADLADDDAIAQKAAFWLTILVGGPTGPDREVGATTAIPHKTELLHVGRDGRTLTVDLSSGFTSGGGSLARQLRVAQVIYTATQFEGIDAARILIDGQQLEAIGGERLDHSDPLTRRDFQERAPAIVVEEPRPEQEIADGAIVSGFANVFEANVSIRLRGAEGKLLVKDFTTATCGSGCWGDFTYELDFQVEAPQEGRLEVLTHSAEDGSERDVISIPVMLVP
ncbi:MAG: GerMN domain-containing protein [Actinomycetota bacterium]|nr:GerMN domain-containing protein [Actinomycetota bacterium]